VGDEDGSLIEKERGRGNIYAYAMMVTGELRGPATWMVYVCFQWIGSDSAPCV
jgi:hypothetical protein